jgi:hypothetical protein
MRWAVQAPTSSPDVGADEPMAHAIFRHSVVTAEQFRPGLLSVCVT